jgi:hypothetical protein
MTVPAHAGNTGTVDGGRWGARDAVCNDQIRSGVKNSLHQRGDTRTEVPARGKRDADVPPDFNRMPIKAMGYR